jgi:hypothetical protein
MKNRLVAVLCVTMVAEPAPTTPASKKGLVNLRPRFELGQEVRFEMDIKSNSSRRGPGMRGDQGMFGEGKKDIGMTVVLKCTGVDPEEGYALDMTIEKFRFEGSLAGEHIRFDSTRPDRNDPMSALFESIVGTTLPVKMDLDGNISGVGGGPLAGMDGGSLLKGAFGSLSTTSKGRGEARVGEAWTNEDVIDGGLGVIRLKTTNTLKSHARGVATIVSRGTFSLDPSSSKAGIRVREGDLSGQTQWDTETGMLESMDWRQKLTVERQGRGGEAPSVTSEDVTMKVQRLKSGRRGR